MPNTVRCRFYTGDIQMNTKGKYKISVYLKEEGKVKVGPPVYVDTPQDAFVRAVVQMKLMVRKGEGDIFLLIRDKESNSTVLSELTEENIIIEIYPNILSNGVDRVGPYCASTQTWLSGTDGIAEA